MKALPKMVNDPEVEKLLEQLQNLNKQFRIVVDRAVNPYNLLCCRTGFRICQKGIFGTID